MIKLKHILQKFYIIIILAMIYIPLIIIVLLSFNGQTARGNIIINFNNNFNFSNYILLFTNNEFINTFLNSLLISVFVVPISIIIATLTSFGMWLNKKNNFASSFINIANKISIAIPEPITAISLALLFTSTWIALGFNFGLFTVILSHISFCTPYAIIVIYPKIQKMNKNYLLSSYDLGYSKMESFFKIVIPYLLPSIFSASVIVLAMSFDDFIITNLINGSTQTISTAIYTARKGIKAWVITFGAIIVIFSILITGIIILIKYLKIKSENKNRFLTKITRKK